MKKKILVVCSKGRNRSKYLAGYLRRKGYLTRNGGVEPYRSKEHKEKYKSSLIKQEDVDWAEIIVVVRRRLVKILKKKFKIGKKKLIALNVTDSKKSIPKKYAHLKELDHKSFQKAWTYPQLRKAINGKII